MQMGSIPGCPTSLPEHPESSEDWFQAETRTLVGYQKKKKTQDCFYLQNTVLTSQSASLLCKEDLVRIAKTKTSAGVFKI